MFLTGLRRTLVGAVMYPFERFTERAKKVLTLAQEEAERSHHSYIGTEHLLLGLLRERESTAAEVLRELGIHIGAVRQTIATVLGRNERIFIQQVIPTSRVKKVIEIAFEEASRRDHEFVEPGHLLAGLVIEGEGIAAHVLSDLGATAEKVLEALDRKWKVESRLTRKPPPMPRRVGGMRTLVGFREPQQPPSDSESLLRLLAQADIAELLARHGLDATRLAERLRNPPDDVVNLRRHLSSARAELADAASHQDFERAARMQKRVEMLIARLGGADSAWLKSLGA